MIKSKKKEKRKKKHDKITKERERERKFGYIDFYLLFIIYYFNDVLPKS